MKLSFKLKRAYGIVRLYALNEPAELLLRLAGKKTFLLADLFTLKLLERFGIELEIHDAEPTSKQAVEAGIVKNTPE